MPGADLAGQRFGRLVAMNVASFRITNKIVWRCLCDCGSEAFAIVPHLRDGRRVSCGCAKVAGNQIKKKAPVHGHCIDDKSTSTYRIWSGMHTRCTNPKTPNFARYGGRGVKVCEQWASFSTFLRDMGEHPAGLSLDRIDNDGNYEAANCRWATNVEQHRNRSDNKIVEFRGESCTLAEWEDRLCMRRGLLRERLLCGWDVERAMTAPLMTKSEAAILGNQSRWG